MFGLEIITSSEYEELVSARETLGDRVRYLESKLSNADNALKAVEKKLQDALLESSRHEAALLSSREHNANHIEVMELVTDPPAVRSCQNCKYHNPLLCAVNPKRSLNYFASNDCPHWEPYDTSNTARL